MGEITVNAVKELRERTGAGFMDCKKALSEAGGDMEKAVEELRIKGLAQAAKKAGRAATEGVVDAYIHGGGRIGVLTEVNCETDFVARTQEFRQLAHEIAMQVAAANPQFVSKDDVPEDVLAKEKEILRAQVIADGKPEKIADKIVEGRIEKYYERACLLEQPYIRDPEIKISDLIKRSVAKFGENLVVRRFARFELGQDGE